MRTFIHQKWVKRTGVFCALLLIMSIVFTGVYCSKASLVNRYVKARSSQKAGPFENIKGYLVWADNNEQITNDEARYTNFDVLDKSQREELAAELKKATAKDDVYVKSVGRKFFIFPDYRIAMKPMSLTIKTNVPDVDILLNRKKVTVSTSEDFTTDIKRLPISDYTASLDGMYKDRKIEVNKKFDGQNKLIDLTVTFKNFTVTSNLKDGDLYFDDSRVGTLREGEYKVVDYPITEAAQVYVKKKFMDGDLLSKKARLAKVAEGANIDLNVDNLLEQQKAGEYLISAFNQLMAYTSSRKDPATINDVFENGVNNVFYKGLKDSVKAKLETDLRRASSLAIPNIVLNNMTQVGKESYLLDFSATYVFGYSADTDPDKKTAGNITQELNGKVTLKKSGDHYVVSQSGTKNITVTSENNQVKPPAVVPEASVGTWVLDKDNTTYTLTISENGNVTRKVDYKDPKRKDETMTAKVIKFVDRGNNNYQLFFEQESSGSIMIIGGGVGGIGVKYTQGVHLDGNNLTPIIWQTGSQSDFDFNKPASGFSMKKQ